MKIKTKMTIEQICFFTTTGLKNLYEAVVAQAVRENPQFSFTAEEAFIKGSILTSRMIAAQLKRIEELQPKRGKS